MLSRGSGCRCPRQPACKVPLRRRLRLIEVRIAPTRIVLGIIIVSLDLVVHQPGASPLDPVRQGGVDSSAFEAAIGQAAWGGICAGSGSVAGVISSAMASTCM